MALAMQQTVRIKGEPHAAAAAGTLHVWKVQKGQIVAVGEVLATVRSAENGGYRVRAAVSGVVRALLASPGKKLAPGEVVCYVESQGTPAGRESAPAPHTSNTTNGTGKASQSTTQRQRGTDERLSTLPTVGGQQSPSAAAGSPAPKPRRERVKLRGLYLLPSQERAIKRVVADLALDESAPLSLNDSELVRCAIDDFLSRSPASIRASLEAYKRKEKAAGTGAGWPRPGRGGKK
jgi:pyruvate/2-oxoglutarate dehydrogenase complex dihydrolipoamide acyltransferase (E2) component